MNRNKNEVGDNCYLRTARKAWRCQGAAIGRAGSVDCTGLIKVGQRYLECVDSVAAFQSGDRYCIPCARVQLGRMVDWTKVEGAA